MTGWMAAEPVDNHWADLQQAQARWPAFFAGLDAQFLPPQSTHWPDTATLSSALDGRAAQVRGFRAQDPALAYSGADYEREIFAHGLIPTRPQSPHDLFNALSWLRWPAAKAALNRAHVRELAHASQPRNRCRDALTLLDEAGVLVLSPAAELLEHLAGHQWQTAWVQHRQRWQQQVRCLMFGHGLLEQCLSPHVGLTAKALLIQVEPECMEDEASIDAWLAGQIDQRSFNHPHQLSPLPLLGVPDLWPDNENPAFYNNHDYFRPPSTRRPPAPLFKEALINSVAPQA